MTLEPAPLIGLRAPDARHIENWLYRTAAEDNRKGWMIPICGALLDRAKTQRQKLEQFSPAVICPDCIRVARLWYAAKYFVTWDRVQRRRLLEALEWDLQKQEEAS